MRKMDDLREEVCIQKCSMRRCVNYRLKSAGHVERMREDHLTNRMEEGGHRTSYKRLNYVTLSEKDLGNEM